MHFLKRKKPQEQPQNSFAVKDLAVVLSEHDVVDVAQTNVGPVLLVTGKTNDSTPASNYIPENFKLSEDLYAPYLEPSAQARASGATIQPLPGTVPAQRVKLADALGGSSLVQRGSQAVNLNELGSSSPSPWISFARREYNPDLLGLAGLQKYDQMRRNDGIVRGTLRSVKTPPLSARWFMVPGDKEKVADVNASEWVWDNLTNGMSIGFTQVLTEALLMCDFGYYMFEIVWEDTGDRLKVKKLAPRHPMDVRSWTYDANGGVDGAWFFPNDYNETDVWIPIDKLLVFTFDREAGDMQGISILRSAYKHWYFKDQLYKIDAIQKERHGIGVPVVKLPPGYTDNDKMLAINMARNLRTNESAHIVLPPLWEIFFAKLEGQVVDAIESIKMHDNAIRENILLQFMEAANNNGQEGSETAAMFFKATRFIADIICDTFNLYLIPRMIDANFYRVGYPKLKARRIGESTDWRTLSFAVRNLIGCGALRPDDNLEKWLRDEMDMPEVDEATVRDVIGLTGQQQDTSTPDQRGAKSGLPRQANIPSAPGMRQNTGTDSSGG